MQELSPVAKIAAPVSALSLTLVCADVEIRQGEGSAVEVSAQTPAFWKVTDDGQITEVGGPVAEALKSTSNTSISANNFISINCGWIDGQLYINNRKVEVPDPREQLVIYLPVGFAGDLVIDADYFGAISIDAALKGKVKAKVSMRVSLKMVDQPTLTDATLKASTGGTISAGLLVASEGRVKLEASNGDSSVTTGNVRAAEVAAKVSTGASVVGKNVRCSGSVEFVAGNGSSCIEMGNVSALDVVAKAATGGKVIGKNLSARNGIDIDSGTNSSVRVEDVWADELNLKGATNGSIDLGNADVGRLSADASTTGSVTISKGSAKNGKAKAGTGGRVNLAGEFQAIEKREGTGGRVNITARKGDAGDRFVRAAKRDFNRDLWENTYASVIAITIAAAMAPAMLQGAAETLADEATVDVICKAMGPTYRDAAVLESIHNCGAAFGQALGPIENLSDAQAAGQAMQVPAVAELFGQAFQLFVGTAFKTAETLAA